MRFSVLNLGCKVNAYETEAIALEMENRGHERCDFAEESDVSMIFTCAVTNKAAQKSRQMIHRAKRNSQIVVVAGCYAQIDPDALEDADILVGSAHKKLIPDYIEQYQENHEKIKDADQIEVIPFENMMMDRYDSQTRAYLKVQDGCNQFCTYCVIPYARGRERSMNPDLVVSEAKRISQTHKEIVLAGIHTGRYGKEYGVTLSQLISRVLNECDQLERLRISSIEITEIDDALIQLMKEDQRIARHLHIPLQSGSDSVLRRMGRPYQTDDFYKRIQYIRSQVPNVSISTDLIVGFPNETEDEFEESYAFLKKCNFSFLHVFPFSKRDGTKAADMPCQIDGITKKKRSKICVELSEELYDQYKQSFIGKSVDVIIEAPLDHGHGHSSEYLPVEINQTFSRGEMVKVEITKFENHQLFGKAIL